MCLDLISCFSYMICLGGCSSECKEMYAFCFHWVRISWRYLLISFDLWSSLILLPFCIILLFYFLRIVFCLKAGSHFVTPDGLELRINPSTSDSWLLRSHVWTTIVDWSFIDWMTCMIHLLVRPIYCVRLSVFHVQYSFIINLDEPLFRASF